jgi:RimJ/RimL family protein N-acetyltransferase
MLARLPHVERLGPCATIGVERDGRLVGAVVFHNFTGQDIQFGAVGAEPGWLTPGLARMAARYAFDQVGVERVTAITPRTNRPARRALEKLGFRLEGKMRRLFGTAGAPRVDGMIYGLLRGERRW